MADFLIIGVHVVNINGGGLPLVTVLSLSNDCLIAGFQSSLPLLRLPSPPSLSLDGLLKLTLGYFGLFIQIFSRFVGDVCHTLLVTLHLQGVWIHFKFLDMAYRWHILPIVLLVLLLPAKLAQLEHLQPALVAKDVGAELDHLTVDCIVRWDVSDQSSVAWLDVCDHL